MADVNTLNDLFIENLRRAYDAEQRLVKALPKLHDAATSEELRHALQTHAEQTQIHVDRLDQIFGWFGDKPKAQTCKSIKGSLDDSKHVMELDTDADVKDAAIIAAAQEAEHFEMALYGTLRTWAVVLGNNQAMEALEVTLEEEKAADALLTSVAATLNLHAAHVD
jgi:ferritin-like metal-binding protein YciE